jgi:hypothetical protein
VIFRHILNSMLCCLKSNVVLLNISFSFFVIVLVIQFRQL